MQRFSSIKKAISYCGLCGTEKSSGNMVQRTPLSKKKHQASTNNTNRSRHDGRALQHSAALRP